MIDKEKFKNEILKAASSTIERNKIGLLSEKALHSVIKNYLAEKVYQEQKIGSYYADILIEDKVIEIQTAHFNKLREKLNYFLNECKLEVTVVYPIAYKKTIYWIDPVNNSIINKRLSNKKGKFVHCFKELYKIKPYLNNEKLHIKLMLIDVDEYKYLNGWDKTKKRGSSRIERIPQDLVDILDLKENTDYSFFTKGIIDEFTSKEFKLLHKISLNEASLALNLLHHLGVIARTGKKGKSYVYKNIMEEK